MVSAAQLPKPAAVHADAELLRIAVELADLEIAADALQCADPPAREGDDAALDLIIEGISDAEDLIAATPATTMDGLRIKARLYAQHAKPPCEGTFDEDVLWSLLRDLGAEPQEWVP